MDAPTVARLIAGAGGSPAPADPDSVATGLSRPAWLLHVDESLVVVDKPAGLPSVPGRAAGLQDCAAARVQSSYGDARVVHRLDMATSGLLVFARGLTAQQALGSAFERREVGKTYEAWVIGQPADAGEIDLPLIADWPRRPLQVVDAMRGKPAVTRWRVLARTDAAARLELHPLTGRTHQLRVHLAAIGHPILGDALYAPLEVQALSDRLCLHATRLELPHPRSGKRVLFTSAAPF